MKILLISATDKEIGPLTEYITGTWEPIAAGRYCNNHHTIQFLTGGVGMAATTYYLTKALQREQYDLILQAGIGGSFDRTLKIGEVVLVTSEVMGDLGAEDHYNFLDVFELELENTEKAPFNNKRLLMPVTTYHRDIDLPQATGLTVNMVAGSAFTAEARYHKYGCQMESMEGAALHYVCLQERVAFAQVRSISNYVEAMDKTKWDIKTAVVNLNRWLIDFLNRPVAGN